MKELFSKLPLNSVEDILSNVYGDEGKSSIPELEEVIENLGSPSDILDSLVKSDSLTDKVYKKDDKDSYIFPNVAEKTEKTKFWSDKNKSKTAEHIGEIGDLTSVYHKENLKQHTALVIKNLSKQEIDNKKKGLQLLTGLLHDVGRKYLTQTSEKEKSSTDKGFKAGDKVTGQLVAPEQEKLSAYITARYFKNLGISQEEATPFVATTFYQNRLKTDWSKVIEGIEDKDNVELPNEFDHFMNEYGDEAYNLLRSLSAADKGILSYKSLTNAHSYLEQGEKIVHQQLNPFVLNITARKPKTTQEISEKFFANSQMDEFEKDAREESLRRLQKEQNDKQRKINQQTYEEIIKNERILVEEQRRIEAELIGGITTGIGGIAGVIAGAKLAQEFDAERKADDRRKKEMLNVTEQDIIDLDGDGIDDRLETDKGLDLSL